MNGAIWIQYGYDLEYKMVAQLVRHRMTRHEKLNAPLHHVL